MLIRALRAHPPLAVLTVLNTALVPVALLGLLIDDRIIAGSPIWLKPLKFALSLALYGLSLAWALTLTTRLRRTARWAGAVAALGGTIEIVVIVVQVVRGRQSHFNQTTELDASLYAFMGMTIAVVWVMHGLLCVVLLTSGFEDPATATALRFGAVIALAGMAVGFLMTTPARGQDPALGAVGAHSVGAPDGGGQLALTGWSTEAGDLRVPHFIGMHALQLLPLLVALLPAPATPRLVRDLGGAYAGLTALALWQALRGQPVLEPDAATLAGLAALLAWTWFALRRAARDRKRSSAEQDGAPAVSA
ncbi:MULTISPECIES: hypothetical protein [Actinosynnema]|nr:hypothetical protein [Actinosynnema pretiosum]MCP2095482.1 hypothetical protein [Actinosynnema pretiosum]